MYSDTLAQNGNLALWSFLSNVHVCCFTIYRVKKCRSESELGLVIFSFRYHVSAWKLVKISSLCLRCRNFTRMWSGLLLFSWLLPHFVSLFNLKTCISGTFLNLFFHNFIFSIYSFLIWSFHDSHFGAFRYAFHQSSFLLLMSPSFFFFWIIFLRDMR